MRTPVEMKSVDRAAQNVRAPLRLSSASTEEPLESWCNEAERTTRQSPAPRFD
jgi:hypothetical protein